MVRVTYFSIAKAKPVMQSLDECVRIRLRMSVWKDWKNYRISAANVLKPGTTKQKAYQCGNSIKGYCSVTCSPILCCTLNIGYSGKWAMQAFTTLTSGKPNAANIILTYRLMPNRKYCSVRGKQGN